MGRSPQVLPREDRVGRALSLDRWNLPRGASDRPIQHSVSGSPLQPRTYRWLLEMRQAARRASIDGGFQANRESAPVLGNQRFRVESHNRLGAYRDQGSIRVASIPNAPYLSDIPDRPRAPPAASTPRPACS
jgi:hypothetical protein